MFILWKERIININLLNLANDDAMYLITMHRQFMQSSGQNDDDGDDMPYNEEA